MKIRRLNEMVYSVQEERIVDDVIIKLKQINVDGETMQNILEQVGMDDQMLSQLVRSYPKHAIQELMDLDMELRIDEDIDEFLLNLVTKNPKFHKKLSDLLLELDANKYNI